MCDSKKAIIAILLAGFLIRLFLFFNFQKQPEFFYDDDSKGYVQLAENLRAGHSFSWDEKAPYEPNSFRTPGYPVFLLAVRVTFGGYEAALIIQILLVVATAYFIYLISKEWERSKLGLWAAAIFLFSPFSIMVSLRYLTQTLFTFFLIWAVWLWLKFLKSKSAKCFIGAILILPLLALIRPIALYLPIVFILSLVLSFWSDKKLLIKNTAILLAVFFAILSPWLIRNYNLFGKFSLSSIAPYQLYFYDTPAVYATTHKVSYNEARIFLEKDIGQYIKINTFEDYMKYKTGDILNKHAWHYLLESPAKLLITRVDLFVKFFVRDGIHYWISYKLWAFLERGLWIIIFFGFLVFSWHTLKSRDTFDMFVILVILYFALITGAVASAGLRFPVELLVVLSGLFGLSYCWRVLSFWYKPGK